MAASSKKLVRSKSGLRMIAINEAMYDPFALAEPLWSPDTECIQCEACKAKFDFINRRHHCRRCGRCFCGSCCANKCALPRFSFVDPVRQCQECLNKTKKERDFFESHLKVLSTGAEFELTSTAFLEKADIGTPDLYMCTVSKDNRRITFDCISHKHKTHDPIELLEVDSVQLLSDGTGSAASSPVSTPTGSSPLIGVSIRHRDSEGVTQTVRLLATSPNMTSQRQALSWAQALRLAIKLVFERRDQNQSIPYAERLPESTLGLVEAAN